MAQQGANRPGHIISKKAGGVISAYRILKFGSDDEHVIQATAADDVLIGVSIPGSGSDPSGMVDEDEILDMATAGTPAVEYGDTVTRGEKLTSDAQGRAVPAAGGNNVIGTAMNSGVANDIGSVQIDRQVA